MKAACRRSSAWFAAVLVASLLHAALGVCLWQPAPRSEPAARSATLVVRLLDPEIHPDMQLPRGDAARAAAPADGAAPAMKPIASGGQPPPLARPAPPLVRRPAPLTPSAEPRITGAASTSQLATAAAPPQAAGEVETTGTAAAVPLYPTLPLPAATLRYELRRGGLQGEALLSWQPDEAGAGYTLQLEAHLDEALLFKQISRGAFDAAGLAPLRFTEERPRGSRRAVNFQRERGLVSFSGPPITQPLAPGMQDRLSWMVQLPAIVAADPQRARPGAETRLAVAGPRGEADVWVFVSAGMQVIEGEANAADALLLVRQPQRPYDLRVEVWLDAQQHHLPLRVRLGTWPAPWTMELSVAALAPR